MSVIERNPALPVASLSAAEISYLDEGEGKPVMLIHGFASSKEVNWLNPGWVKALVEAGFRVIAHDNRGHGESSKPHDAAVYSLANMANDVLELMDFLGLETPHLIGYSMGARISSRIAVDHGEKVDRIVLGGNGYGMIEGTGSWDPVRDALLADSLDDVADARGRAFRTFADQTGSDRQALASCVTSVRELFTIAEMQTIPNPVLVAIGTKDDVAGSGEKLAEIIPGAQYLAIPNRDHMRAVGDKVFIQGALDFLGD